ncbi:MULTISPECIES: DUF2461 domain-containing protein [Gordonia]|uniref:TIGR02453 family protein n=1 Tax=Gordonia sputi NBRC 100414 TaxID=1089453 RepID=H5U6Q3_9ACTN|nr:MULTISPECIES: DUF2461 domain-containing protein [Gordonia]NKY94731.1 DUF2461 domain-containing protein [Gordonia sputi]OBA69758.1 TIGR02453 family protein [Gordonia sp. 852002-10350_SCH5691597]GAB41411.1 hypothetical protein GOSPT_129_00590 [Gordonia sputi NBRC 100414]
MSFQGFPEAALDFYDDLEVDNSKAFWEQHKQTYQSAVAAPMRELTDALADEFGEAKLFRPYRDVRFSKDKSPYKTHQGAYVAVAPATGYYVQIGAPGVMVGAGFYDASAERLSAMRTAIDDDRRGRELEQIVADLTATGWEVGGGRLKTAPRGWDPGHPRIELLRHKTFTVSHPYGFDAVIHTPELVDRVRDDWRTTAPLIDWLTRHALA